MNEGIKLTGTKFRNFAKFGVIEVEYPEGVSYLCGRNGAGKSSLTIVGLQACIKGIYENNFGGNVVGSRFAFIGPNARSADIGYSFLDQRTNRSFTISNHITASANNIKVEADDELPVPSEWMEDFFSISLMSESHFCSLTPKEQALVLGVNTDSFDEGLKRLKEQATILNREIKKFDSLETVPEFTPVDIPGLKKKKAEISNQLNTIYLENITYNKELREHYENEKRVIEKTQADLELINVQRHNIINNCTDAFVVLETFGYKGKEVGEFIDSLPQPEPVPEMEVVEPEYITELPSDEPIQMIDAELEAAYVNNAQAEKYQEYLKRLDEKEALKKELEDNMSRQGGLKNDRIKYINDFSFGFSGLSTNEKGELELNGRQIKKPYFSTGERIKIVAKLMASRHPLFKTVFLDSACELDPENLEEIIKYFDDEGFNIIVSIPNEKRIDGKHCIVLRQCELVDNVEGETLL